MPFKFMGLRPKNACAFILALCQPGISINCLKTILTPCQPPVASHNWGGWQGMRMDAQAFLDAPNHP